jgi:hypothetical protein
MDRPFAAASYGAGTVPSTVEMPLLGEATRGPYSSALALALALENRL